MLKARVIPCLDVKDGRVVKGVNFVDLIDAGDPVEAGQAPMTPPVPTSSCFLDITGEPREPRHHLRRRGAHGRAMLHAADRGRRRAPDRGYPPPAAGRRRQGLDQLRRRGAAGVRRARRPTSTATSASWWRSTPRQAGAGEAGRWEIFTHGGRETTGIDAVEFGQAHGRSRRRRDPADLDGSRRHQVRLRPRADPRDRRRGAASRSSRPAASARSITWSMAFAKGGASAPCWPPRSSISAPTP